MKGRILTCVYCGMEYPQGTPASGDKVLTDHIKVCERHPLRKAEATIAKLRSALIGLVGAESKEELEGIELVLRTATINERDKASTLNAIHALLDTEEARAETEEARQTSANTQSKPCEHMRWREVIDGAECQDCGAVFQPQH